MAFPSLDSDAELVLCRRGSSEVKPKGEAEVPEIIIVSDAVEGTFVDLQMPSGGAEGKYQREWKRSKGVDRNEMRKEEKI